MEGIYPLTVTLTEKEAIMRKVKLIVHETYQGKRKREGIFATVIAVAAVATVATCGSFAAARQRQHPDPR